MPDLRVEDDTGTYYRVFFEDNALPILRAELIFFEWISVRYATYGLDYVVTQDYMIAESGGEYQARNGGRWRSGGLPIVDTGRLAEQEFRLDFDVSRSPIDSRLLRAALKSIELQAALGPDNALTGFGSFIQFPIGAVPFIVAGRHETQDYYYVKVPIRFGILDAEYQWESANGFDQIDVQLNLMQPLLVFFLGGAGMSVTF